MSLWTRVEERYGLKILDTDRVHGIYKVRTGAGRFCLKKYSFSEENVRFIARLLYSLYERGFTRAQGVYPTVDQTGYVEYGGAYYTLTNWVDGNRPQFRKKLDFKKAIRTLAKFHSAAEGFPAEEAPHSRIRYGEMSQDLMDYRALLQRHEQTAFLVPLCDEVIHMLAQPFAAEAVAAEQRVSAFVHGDYNYPNLIKDRQRKLHLIDFENTSLNERMRDLSHILHRNFLWNGSGMLRWIDYYNRKRPLSPYDRHLLHAFLSAPYHVVRNIRIGGLRNALPVIPSPSVLHRYRRELSALL